MKGIVIIPAHQRPDFIAACIRFITEAKGWQDYYYLFMLDRGFHKDCLTVAEAFPGQKEIHTFPFGHYGKGNSYNILTGYKLARMWLDGKPGLCHLIEEDIFIGPGYFDFHEKAWQADPSAFCVSACKNMTREGTGDTDTVYRDGFYQSLGVSFKAESLDYFLPHACERYFKNMRSYCEDMKTRMGGSDTEQDGLIRRVMILHDLHCLYPDSPRAFHAGFTGYNRPGKKLNPSISVGERADILYNMSEAELNNRAVHPAHRDIHKCRMEYFEPEMLKLRT